MTFDVILAHLTKYHKELQSNTDGKKIVIDDSKMELHSDTINTNCLAELIINKIYNFYQDSNFSISDMYLKQPNTIYKHTNNIPNFLYFIQKFI